MLKKTTFWVILALGLGILSQQSLGSSLGLGKPAPTFLLESGDSQKLSLDMTRGKVVVLFYESRHAIKKNLKLKDELKRLYRAQPAPIKHDIFRLVVIDCSEASRITTPIWKLELIRHSREAGFTIYGDWTKRMFADYCMKDGESNFLIIDKQGIIRYTATGKIANDQIPKIEDLLFTLVKEN